MLATLGTGLAVLTLAVVGNAPSALASPVGAQSGSGLQPPAEAGAATQVLPGPSGPAPVTVARLSGSSPAMAPLRKLLEADLFVVAPTTLPSGVATAVQRLRGVAAAQRLDAARLEVDGKLTATLGVDPSEFRAFAAKPVAQSLGLWKNVAAGGVAVSYTMSKLDNLPIGHTVRVTGRRTEELPVAGLGTVGIGGVDAVVSDAVARSLGIPADNAIVISAPHADLSTLMKQIKKLLPRSAAVASLVAQSASSGVAETGGAAGIAGTAADGPGLTYAEVVAFLKAAESRLGLPYVWGGDGPTVFDCSGLVQWSFAQAGVVMPRVAAEQALTGPQVPLSELQPGDLLFYHTDPTAPDYISHVAIYLGDGKMEQAPEPGLDVEIVPADFGSEFAGAVAVSPKVAAAVAGDPAA
ncbi:MAG TPA: C40 family peptidase [Streptosporangiaceae bacterium]|nr:C40 family peptidase [Streptosporangiaceae bacterium]